MEVALAGAGLLYTGRLAFSYRRVKSASFDGGASAPPFFFFFFFFQGDALAARYRFLVAVSVWVRSNAL